MEQPDAATLVDLLTALRGDDWPTTLSDVRSWEERHGLDSEAVPPAVHYGRNFFDGEYAGASWMVPYATPEAQAEVMAGLREGLGEPTEADPRGAAVWAAADFTIEAYAHPSREFPGRGSIPPMLQLHLNHSARAGAQEADALAQPAIRGAIADDLPYLAAMHWQASTGSAEVPEEFSEDFVTWAQTRDQHNCWVAYSGESFPGEQVPTYAGMIWLSFVEGVPGPEARRRRSGVVDGCVVAPEFADTDVEHRMLRQVLDRALEVGLERVIAYADIAPATYAEAGFAPSDAVRVRDLG